MNYFKNKNLIANKSLNDTLLDLYKEVSSEKKYAINLADLFKNCMINSEMFSLYNCKISKNLLNKSEINVHELIRDTYIIRMLCKYLYIKDIANMGDIISDKKGVTFIIDKLSNIYKIIAVIENLHQKHFISNLKNFESTFKPNRVYIVTLTFIMETNSTMLKEEDLNGIFHTSSFEYPFKKDIIVDFDILLIRVATALIAFQNINPILNYKLLTINITSK